MTGNLQSKVIEMIKSKHLEKEIKIVSAADVKCVTDFIKTVWNEHVHSGISAYLHDQFIDHSMPYDFLQNKEGLLIYLKEMTARISHYTEILEISRFDDFVFCKIRITIAKHSGSADKAEYPVIIEGYRFFKMHQNRIIAHWEMI